MTYKAAVAAVDESIYVSHLTTSVLTLIFKLIGLGSCHDASSEVDVHDLHCSRVSKSARHARPGGRCEQDEKKEGLTHKTGAVKEHRTRY